MRIVHLRNPKGMSWIGSMALAQTGVMSQWAQVTLSRDELAALVPKYAAAHTRGMHITGRVATFLVQAK